MSLIVSQSNSDFNFEKCPEGNHIAVCFSVVDLGLQEVNFQGDISVKRKVRISWEIPGELMKEGDFAGKPFSISKNYTLSFHEKAVLYKDLISWRGRAFTTEELSGFDLFTILGAPCMLNVLHQTSGDGQKVYANVVSVSQLPKGIEKPIPLNPIRKFSTDSYTDTEYENLEDWLKEKINLPNPSSQQAPPPTEDPFDDDIPF
jgi:hypothetical protein